MGGPAPSSVRHGRVCRRVPVEARVACQSRTDPRARQRARQRVLDADLDALSEKNGGRFKRIRRSLRHKPNADALKREVLAEFEALSQQGHLDVLYGDESRVSLLPCVPYGWQFADEQVTIPSHRRGGVNCFALLPRDNRLHLCLTERTIDAAFVSEQLDAFSWFLCRPPVIVSDNA